MEDLANSFSVLELDADDSNIQPLSLPSGSSGKKANGKALPAKNEIQDQQNPVTYSSEYRLPLVWIDLEMTGLNIEVDRILEIACIITDGNLTKSVEGPDLVIHQTKECLDRMGEWCTSHHAASGLTKKVLESTISEREAEKQNAADPVLAELLSVCKCNLNSWDSVIAFVKKHIGGTYKPLLAGNSIYVDFQYLKKYMPELAEIFSHVVVDVSSISALCIRWYPKDQKKVPSKEKRHRALDDIRESIEELKYYKANIFKPKIKK